VMPALDANGDYVHLLLSHNSKVGEAPVLSEVIPQPTQTPKAEREVFEAELAERRARHRINGAPFHSGTTGYLSGFHPGTPC
ncbi:hypothetical protein, partial [Vibrio cholerae]|uniref:hypothetical protein n=1 Tax=Vibrio cholerae TaxID=666 RepID=UPI00308011C0